MIKIFLLLLRDTELSFLSNDPIHIEDIYQDIQQRYPELCDDNYLCSDNCLSGNNQPEWKHMVRSVINTLRLKGIAERTANRGEWLIRPREL